MKKISFLASAMALISMITLASCSNPSAPTVNNYLPNDMIVEITKSDTAAKFTANSILEQIGTFTDNFNINFNIETRLDKKYIETFDNSEPTALSNCTDLLLLYPMSFMEYLDNIEKNPDLASYVKHTTFYAKFNTKESLLEIKRGAYGDGATEKYYYMVLPDSENEVEPNGFDIYIAKQNGGKAVAMISKISSPMGSDTTTFEYSTLTTPATSVETNNFKQFRNEKIYSDFINTEFELKTASTDEEKNKIKSESTKMLIKKYPEYLKLTSNNKYPENFFFDKNFPNDYTKKVWQNKKKIDQEFNTKKSDVNNFFNKFYTRANYDTDSINQNYLGKINETPVTYTANGYNAEDVLSIEELDNYKFKFHEMKTFRDQFFTDQWYYEYNNGKLTAYLTDKGYENKGASSQLKEGDSVSISLTASTCENETLPKAITISAKTPILSEFAEIKLERENYTATELNELFASAPTWKITAASSKNSIPAGIINFVKIPCKDNIWNLEDSDKNLYITYTSNLKKDYYYVNETKSPIIFYDSYNSNLPVVKSYNIDLGNLKSDPEVELPAEDATNSMKNLNGYVVTSVIYTNDCIILNGDTSREGYPAVVTLERAE